MGTVRDALSYSCICTVTPASFVDKKKGLATRPSSRITYKNDKTMVGVQRKHIDDLKTQCDSLQIIIPNASHSCSPFPSISM